MRRIGTFETEEKAKLFSDYLYSREIESSVEQGRDGAWQLWAHSEDEIENAARLLKEFKENPDDPRYRQARRKALAKRAAAQESRKKARKRQVDLGRAGRARATDTAFVTLFLIGLSVTVTLTAVLPENEEAIRRLQISEYARGLPEVVSGQVWRLVTPILLHFSPLHILFNMLWLYQLGGMIERRHGHLYFAVMVVLLAALSNLAQVAVANPNFGGMSGVVYGLLGYAWLRGRRQASSGLFVNQGTMTMMIVWYFLCLFGIIPRVANAAHTAGLLLGLGWAYLTATLSRR